MALAFDKKTFSQGRCCAPELLVLWTLSEIWRLFAQRFSDCFECNKSIEETIIAAGKYETGDSRNKIYRLLYP